MEKFNFIDLKTRKELLEKELDKMVIPTPSISVEFSMMQKLFSYWVKKKHYYGNWSGTGVGKTYSFILASRVIDSHMTVVIGTNSTTCQLAGEIKELYNDSVVEVYDGKLPDFDMTKHNYLIFNYEKGQQEYSKKLFDSVLKKYKVDYIVFDEVQLVKQTKNKDCSTRRKNFMDFRNKSVEMYDSYVSVITATPYVNNIFEVISILTLMTGDDYKNIKRRNILKNTIAVENLLNSLGVLSNTEPKNVDGKVIEKNIQIEEILGDNKTFESFKKSLHSKSLSVYQSTLQEKLDYIYVNDLVKKGELTIIFTLFTEDIVRRTKSFFSDLGFKVCVYTGETKDTDPYINKYGKVDWKIVKDNYDIILSSRPISVGVDGLQKVCNNMVILSLPWTYSDFNQLIGRIYRKNSNFEKVNVWIPVVRFPQKNNVGYDDKVWNTIQNKGIYSNACLNGEFPDDGGSIHTSIIRDLKMEIFGTNEMNDSYLYAA